MESTKITQLLIDWSNGESAALNELMPLVYNELHRLAHSCLRSERSNHTLQATALINDVYLRFVDWENVRWQNRAHFFGVAAQLMRKILVDHARSRLAAKRGGGGYMLSLDDFQGFTEAHDEDMVALDNALVRLAAISERQSRIIELRFFGGLTIEETAEILQVAPVTVNRDWNFAKTWLMREMLKKG